MTASSSQKAARFYDGLAGDYELVYGGEWERAVDQQARALDRLIRTYVPHAGSVLDCACGIGTQAIGLAGLGYRVVGTDLSHGMAACPAGRRSRGAVGPRPTRLDRRAARTRDPAAHAPRTRPSSL